MSYDVLLYNIPYIYIIIYITVEVYSFQKLLSESAVTNIRIFLTTNINSMIRSLHMSSRSSTKRSYKQDTLLAEKAGIWVALSILASW